MSHSVQPAEDVSAGYEVSAQTFEDITVGTTATLSKVVDETDVANFASASADTNPLHLDETYAKETRFNQPIAHGVLVAGTVSAALARLPGIVIYLGQKLEFCAPVYVGDEVTAVCEVTEAVGDDRYRLQTTVQNEEGTIVIDGGATVLIEAEPTV